MKKHRFAAAGLALALATGSVAIAGPAIAADIYVSGDVTATEGDSYPAGWFTGSDPAAAAVPHGTDAGLEVTGRTVLLYGQTTDVTDGAHLSSLLASAAADATGTAVFQIPMFWNSEAEGDKVFTTLRPTGDGDWTTSRAVGPFAANSSNPIEDYAAFLDAAIEEGGWTPQVLAFGVIVPEGEQAVVRSVSFAGDNHIFTKAPAAPVANPVQKPATFTG